MSVATPTVVSRTPLFPTLLPKPPQPHLLPVPMHSQRRARLNTIRDLSKEMEDLSEEEEQWEDLTSDIRNRGFNFLIPIGRSLTQHEEKNDADASEDDDDDGDDDGGDETEDTAPSDEPSDGEDEDNDEIEGQDLDADMEDLDEVANTTAETDEMDADESGDIAQAPSSDL